MGVVQFVRFIFAYLLGLFFASLQSLRLLIVFIKGPIAFISGTLLKKKRQMPVCLNDPRLGSHGFIHLEEVKLHYVAIGDESKPLMLCLHGFPEFWYSWRNQLKEFKNDYRVVAVDMRGYGDSDKPAGIENYRTEKLVGDIKQLIPALGYASCTLVAHDWGGFVAWHFAMDHPDMIDKLIVMNCPHPAAYRKHLQSSWSQFKKSGYVMFFQTPFVPELAFTHSNNKALESVYRQVEKTGNMSKEDVEAYKYTFATMGSLTGPINYYRAAIRHSDKLVRSIITLPTLIIWGLPDYYLDREMAEITGKYVENLKIKYLENSNHFVQMSSPSEVNKAMREFLS